MSNEATTVSVPKALLTNMVEFVQGNGQLLQKFATRDSVIHAAIEETADHLVSLGLVSPVKRAALIKEFQEKPEMVFVHLRKLASDAANPQPSTLGRPTEKLASEPSRGGRPRTAADIAFEEAMNVA